MTNNHTADSHTILRNAEVRERRWMTTLVNSAKLFLIDSARVRRYSRTATRHTTQASISNRIATLERDLGVRLFDRDIRRITLTVAGQLAVAKAEEVIRATTEFREALADPSAMQGSISIGTIDSIVHSFLPRLFERVQERRASPAELAQTF
jgi:DNA-binding transcriptional LysR family regulator